MTRFVRTASSHLVEQSGSGEQQRGSGVRGKRKRRSGEAWGGGGVGEDDKAFRVPVPRVRFVGKKLVEAMVLATVFQVVCLGAREGQRDTQAVEGGVVGFFVLGLVVGWLWSDAGGGWQQRGEGEPGGVEEKAKGIFSEILAGMVRGCLGRPRAVLGIGLAVATALLGPEAQTRMLMGSLAVGLQARVTAGWEWAPQATACGAMLVLMAAAEVLAAGWGGSQCKAPGEGWVVAVMHGVQRALLVVPWGVLLMRLRGDERRHAEIMQRLLEELAAEDKLLAVLVPRRVAKLLHAGKQQVAKSYPEAVVLFIYLPDFKEVLSRHGTGSTVEWLQEVYRCFDECMSEGQWSNLVIKTETFSNFLMTVSARNDVNEDPEAMSIAYALEAMRQAGAVLLPDGSPTRFKAGIHCGGLCAGVVGDRSPRFSVFGDTVNTASRIASSAVPCTGAAPALHLSAVVAEQLQERLLEGLEAQGLTLADRGEVTLKGKGQVHTYELRQSVHASEAPPQGVGLAGADARGGAEGERTPSPASRLRAALGPGPLRGVPLSRSRRVLPGLRGGEGSGEDGAESSYREEGHGGVAPACGPGWGWSGDDAKAQAAAGARHGEHEGCNGTQRRFQRRSFKAGEGWAAVSRNGPGRNGTAAAAGGPQRRKSVQDRLVRGESESAISLFGLGGGWGSVKVRGSKEAGEGGEWQTGQQGPRRQRRHTDTAPSLLADTGSLELELGVMEGRLQTKRTLMPPPSGGSDGSKSGVESGQ